ncbi:MAG: DUF448 domain-containing protein [Alphaproteobacteria bacterium]
MEKENSLTRCCLVNRKVLPTTEMIRFVVSPDNKVIPDIKGTLPGRGMWIECNPNSIAKAIKGNLFSKSAKKSVNVDADLLELTEKLLRKRIIEHISLARRSGNGINGFEKVKELLKSGECHLVFLSNAQSDSSEKLIGMCKMLELPFYTVLSIDDLSQIMAGENVNYAGIKKCGISNVINTEATKLSMLIDGE